MWKNKHAWWNNTGKGKKDCMVQGIAWHHWTDWLHKNKRKECHQGKTDNVKDLVRAQETYNHLSMCHIFIVPCGHRLLFVYDSQMRRIGEKSCLLWILWVLNYVYILVSCLLLCLRAMYGYIHIISINMEESMVLYHKKL